ncbi:DUF4838 domain-containing protein [Cyclobacterium jeungdonense]|uniref:DUF4838 domain-containing protein n=1 Tax=Cyclobacterium jeungdonense TaxID=708087 RepID=A0ABT8C884_9BACT|nr:DUF4838 domain-containing protein [Cyclobacterium jeungdonense]MDN3687871.1 DUF4838 domain-containing protein [Cyclobacterium jeungdonense]
MKKIISLLLAFSFLASGLAQELTLVKNRKSDFTIIIPEHPSVEEVHGAKVLQHYLLKISGAQLPVKTDKGLPGQNEILIGSVIRPETALVPYDQMGRDGIYIRNNGRQLILTGGPKKGVVYAVYTFLEEYLNCKKYTSSFEVVPKQKTISIPAIDELQVPDFTFREVFYNDAYDSKFMDWHKLHSHGERGNSPSEWGYWVHTFHNFLNPAEYGESHPEYFSFYEGKRHAGLVPSWDGKSVQPESQLCLSNPEVLDIVCQNLQKAIDERPEALYWSVSQNDNVNYCQCEHCAALDAKYAAFAPEDKMYATHGSQYPALGMGSLLTFINKVAERFPDKIISTLAYQYTRVPPKNLVPRDNVNIMLCSIESTRNEPIESGDPDFSEDLKGWAQLTDNILVWDYNIQFANLLAPFPNLRTLQPNISFLRNNNVSAVFAQGNIQSGGESAELRAYLLAKLLWNPDLDVDREMKDFLNAYYGKAAPFVNDYINLLHDNNKGFTGRKMSIFGSPIQEGDSFLSPELIANYNALFDKAEKAVRKNPEQLTRVKSARLPVYFAMLEIMKEKSAGNWETFQEQGKRKARLPDEVSQLLYEFYYLCMDAQVSRIAEWHTTPSEYLENYPLIEKE